MESSMHGQGNCPLCPGIASQCHRTVHTLWFSGYNNLLRRIDVCDSYDAMLRRLLAERLDSLLIQSNNGSHPAWLCFRCRCHRFAARLNQTQTRRKINYPCRVQSAIFTQAMTSNRTRHDAVLGKQIVATDTADI
jgi:hypothetical protein